MQTTQHNVWLTKENVLDFNIPANFPTMSIVLHTNIPELSVTILRYSFSFPVHSVLLLLHFCLPESTHMDKNISFVLWYKVQSWFSNLFQGYLITYVWNILENHRFYIGYRFQDILDVDSSKLFLLLAYNMPTWINNTSLLYRLICWQTSKLIQ